MIEFKPNVNPEMETPNFRAYMIEIAWDYYILAISHQKNYLTLSLCCLSLEIILKSFNAEVADNEGKLNEKYRQNKKVRSLGKKAHDLISLLEIIEKDHRDYLFSRSEVEILESHRNFFTTSRYGYEKSVSHINHHEIKKLTASTLCKIIFLYQQKGCSDPFIQQFNVNQFYNENVQTALLYTAP